MKKTDAYVIAFAILFLFLIQMTGTLFQSIYILDLMHTSLDEKVLGILFLFSPALLLAFRKGFPRGLVWALTGLLLVSRGVTPYLDTAGRLLAAGAGTASALMLLPFWWGRPDAEESVPPANWAGPAALALAVGLSVLLRSLNFSVDYSLTPAGSWLGWGLGLALAGLLARLIGRQERPALAQPGARRGLLLPVLGIFLVLALVYFAFSAPVVIARWTGASIPAVVGGVALLSAAWAWLAVCRPGWLERISSRLLAAWNLAFTLCLVGTILAQGVSFPAAAGQVTLAAGTLNPLQTLLLAGLLLLFPVIFLDLGIFLRRVALPARSPAAWVPGLLLGSLALVLLVFANVFTNVWGYIDPVSTLFRGLYWLPFLLCAGGAGLIAGLLPGRITETAPAEPRLSWGWTAALALLAVGSLIAVWRVAPAPVVAANPGSLVLMTYNVQAGNDNAAEPALDRQLALIRQVSPDVLALQESDTARISLNNNDLVSYFAGNLGYYAYYGPTPVTGTFGTALLSKYPLQNPGVIFSYSDTDEIGTTVAEIEAAGRRFTIYNVHPDGSKPVMLAWAQTLLEQAKGKTNVIALGDYNTRKTDPAYPLIAAQYTNAWTNLYPSEISPEGLDMSGRSRIDHIFVSPDLTVKDAEYVLPPASATDHPVHWAEISWK